MMPLDKCVLLVENHFLLFFYIFSKEASHPLITQILITGLRSKSFLGLLDIVLK